MRVYFESILREHAVLNRRVRDNFLVGRGDGEVDSRLRTELWNHNHVRPEMSDGRIQA